MALFAIYRIQANSLLVLLNDVRSGNQSVQHHCTLPNEPGLIEDLTEALRLMGYTPEFNRTTVNERETKHFWVHRSPPRTADSADAIREVCVSRDIEAEISTTDGDSMLRPPKKRRPVDLATSDCRRTSA